MKKTILILLLLAAIAVAWWYFEPTNPDANKIATVQNVDVKDVIKQRNLTDTNEDTDKGESEEEVEAILPWKKVAEVQSANIGEVNIPKGDATYSLVSWSVISWLWKKVWWQHNGVINITNGSLEVSWWNILWWKFTMDMTSLKATDIDSSKLDETIKEWFNVENHKTAEFIILEVWVREVSWIMTINWISKQISFPATIVIEEDTIIANAAFALDRNEWDVAWWTPAVSEFMELELALTWKQ